MYHSYIYLVCTNCKKKQFIGADMEEIVNTMEFLINGARETKMAGNAGNSIAGALTGISQNVLVALKFLKKHFNHNIVLWNASEGEPIPWMIQTDDSAVGKYALFEDEWVMDDKTGQYTAPRWPSVLPEMHREYNPLLLEQIDSWKKAYQNEYILRNKLEQIVFKKDPTKVKQLTDELKSMVNDSFSVSQKPAEKDYETAVNLALAAALKDVSKRDVSTIEQLMKTIEVEVEEGVK